MDIIDPAISSYAEEFTSHEPDYLRELNRETYANVLMPRMLSGHLQGRFISMLSKMIRPKNILEIGTYTGYSALCLVEGLTNDGQLISIDVNEETSAFAKKIISQTEFDSKINLIVDDAKTYIPTITQNIDIVFIDADKKNYLTYYHLIIDKLNSGGLIIADNVLWSGKITMPVEEMDRETKALHDFNCFVQQDDRVENMLLPIRDGLMMMRKK